MASRNVVLKSTLSIATMSFFVAPIYAKFISGAYQAEKICHFQERLNRGCFEKQTGVFRSVIECARLCDTDCVGVSMPDNKTCYFSKKCNSNFTCHPGNVEFELLTRQNPCQHNSNWNQTTDTCKCTGGWVGERCERLAKNCQELKHYGYPLGYEHSTDWIYLDIANYPTPLKVRCVLFDTKEYVYLMYNNGISNNNKSWSDYTTGFCNQEYNYWLGLDKIKALNGAGLTTLAFYITFTDPSGSNNMFRRLYEGFQMDHEFKFNFSSTYTRYNSGSFKDDLVFGDCLGPMVGAKFSTWDQDNDEVPSENCASQAGVGWWFKSCNILCNPLGYSYITRPGQEPKSYMKMGGIDFSNSTIATNGDVSMLFIRE